MDSNKRCTKRYLINCFSELRSSSPSLNEDIEVFTSFLNNYKKANGEYDFSSFGHLNKKIIFDRILNRFMRLYCSGGIIHP